MKNSKEVKALKSKIRHMKKTGELDRVIKQAIEDSNTACKELEEKRRVTWEQMHAPYTI